MGKSKLNKELKEYVVEKILPEYENFDKGHGPEHIEDVWKRSVEYFYIYSKKMNLDINMVFVIATYHDIGIRYGRANHPLSSGKILEKDIFLKKFFSPQEIKIMKEAVEDHSTSSTHFARSVYGMIVADADKDVDLEFGLIRSYEYTLVHSPNITREERIKNIHKEIVRRFGKADIGGQDLVKFYLKNPKATLYKTKMREYAYNFDEFKKDIEIIIDKYLKQENTFAIKQKI